MNSLLTALRSRLESALYPIAQGLVHDPLRRRVETPDEKIVVLLLKPTRDFDDGSPMTFLRGFVPSATLLTMRALTPPHVDGLPVETLPLDEGVLHVDLGAIARIVDAPQNRVIAAICGIQSSQYDRALLLATSLQGLRIPVLLGGFHIMGHEPTRADLVRRGLIPVSGEGEGGIWTRILEDFARGRLAPTYTSSTPDITTAPMPALDQGYQSSYSSPKMHLIDSARGCSFDCSFCTVTTLMGKTLRRRDPERLRSHLRKLSSAGAHDIFVIDDDAYLSYLDARKHREPSVFQVLRQLRDEEGIRFDLLAQADVKSNADRGFMEEYAYAGGYQIFNGVECFDEGALRSMGKRQNLSFEMGDAVGRWHDLGVGYHMSAIIGLDSDTEETGPRMAEYADRCGVDVASWFILTPLPGSRDYDRLASEGRILPAPFNHYDGTHTLVQHPTLPPEAVEKSFWGAYDFFYSIPRILRRIRNAPAKTRADVTRYNFWSWFNACRRRRHPMTGGLFQLRGPVLRAGSAYPDAAPAPA